MIAPIIICYVLGAIGLLAIQVAAANLDPEAMPGGGKPVLIAIALLWPLVIVFLVIGIVLIGASKL